MSYFIILNKCDNFAPESSETAPYCGCGVVHEGNTGAGELPDKMRLVSHLLLAWKEKKSKPNKISYPEIHQQGAEFCLALKKHTALLPHLKICLGVWGRLRCISMRWRFCYSLAPFPLSQWGQSEGAERGREEDIPLVPCSRGTGQEGKWLALWNDQEKPVYSSRYGGCLEFFMLS